MEYKVSRVIEQNTEIYVINNICKIEKWFVQRVHVKITENENLLDRDISNFIYLDCEFYNDGINFCGKTFRLIECFLTKEDLINQL